MFILNEQNDHKMLYVHVSKGFEPKIKKPSK